MSPREGCAWETCMVCQAPVHACGLGVCSDEVGRQLGSGWVCSLACFRIATTAPVAAWPPPRTRWTIPIRILCGVGLTLAATAFMVPATRPDLGLGLSLSGLLACSFCALLTALEKKPEVRGRVGGRR